MKAKVICAKDYKDIQAYDRSLKAYLRNGWESVLEEHCICSECVENWMHEFAVLLKRGD